MSQPRQRRFLRQQTVRRSIPFVVWLLALLFVFVPLLGREPGLRLTGLAIRAQHKILSQANGEAPSQRTAAKQEIVVYVPEHLFLRVKVGLRVTMRRRADRKQRLEGSVRALGTRIVQVPRHANPTATTPTWGLPVYIALPESLQVTQGESFDVILTIQ